jgi:hypothetical protein
MARLRRPPAPARQRAARRVGAVSRRGRRHGALDRYRACTRATNGGQRRCSRNANSRRRSRTRAVSDAGQGGIARRVIHPGARPLVQGRAVDRAREVQLSVRTSERKPRARKRRDRAPGPAHLATACTAGGEGGDARPRDPAVPVPCSVVPLLSTPANRAPRARRPDVTRAAGRRAGPSWRALPRRASAPDRARTGISGRMVPPSPRRSPARRRRCRGSPPLEGSPAEIVAAIQRRDHRPGRRASDTRLAPAGSRRHLILGGAGRHASHRPRYSSSRRPVHGHPLPAR